MKKFATRLLYVFSFSLLFTALYLNFAREDKADITFNSLKKADISASSLSNSNAVAQPETNTLFK
jgi:hypothetical protein